VKVNWGGVVRAIRAQARLAYARQLSLAKRLQYLPPIKNWVHSANAPPINQPYPTAHFRVRLVYLAGHPIQSARYNPAALEEQGGWALPVMGAKCSTLLLSLLWKLSNKDGSLTAALLHLWNLTGAVPNPPLARRFPTQVTYFRQYNRFGLCRTDGGE